MKSEKKTEASEIDKAIEFLENNKGEWANLSIPDKIEMLLEIRKNIGLYAQEWVDLSVSGKQISPDFHLAGEEWVTGPWVFASTINNYVHTLKALHENKRSSLIKKIRSRKNGQLIAQVFPNNIYEKLLMNGVRAEVWMQNDVARDELVSSIGSFYNQKNPPGHVTLVLGAGNINAISPLDVLSKLIEKGDVVLLKPNPINEYLGPVLEKIFEPFIKSKYLKIVYGGAEVGEYLTQHKGIESIHITGSDKTHDIIVYGYGDEGVERKKNNDPILDSDKTITSELSGVGPLIVVPGPWTKGDIAFQTENIVTTKLHNCGHNCVATQVLVIPKNWDLSEKLMNSITDKLKNLPQRIAYYPNANLKHDTIMKEYPDAKVFEGDVPITIIKDLNNNNPKEYGFTSEFFGPELVQTFIEGDDAAAFLKNAVKFCNEKLAGTLGATILIHPKTLKQLGSQFEDIIANLEYGAIGVNVWNAVAFLVTQCTWGAYPGHTFDDIQSGIGVVHNTFLLENAQKTVVYGPFRTIPKAWLHGDVFNMAPKPVWFVSNKNQHDTAKRLTKFAVNPGFNHLPGIFMAALQG